MVLPANISDGEGAKQTLAPIHQNLPRMEKLWVDGGYKEGFQIWVEETTGWKVEVTRRSDVSPAVWGTDDEPPPERPGGFKVIPWRWIVERTFGWMGRYRRLSKDYEELPSSSEAWIWLCMTRLLLQRLGGA